MNTPIRKTAASLLYLLATSLHAQPISQCNLQLTSSGAYVLQVGTPPNVTTSSGTLTSTPLALASSCGSVSFESSTQLYRWTPSASISLRYLLVAGGGAGGMSWGGGGGGGGLLNGSFNAVMNTAYDFAVGQAGTGAVTGLQTGNSGGNTTGFGLTAYGGGGGGGGNAGLGNNGINGGSGGGAGEYVTGGGTLSTSAGSGTAGQGFAGGKQIRGSNAWSTAGGGGGAGSAGVDGLGNSGGTGGSGFTSNITGTSVTYSAGGGGSGYATYGISSGSGGSSGSVGARSSGGLGATGQGQPGGGATTPGSGGGGGSGNGGANGPGMAGLVVISFSTTVAYSPNSNNTFLGYRSGQVNTSAFNTFIGTQAGLFDVNGHGNVYLGYGTGPIFNTLNPAYNAIISVGANSTAPSTLTQNAIGLGSGTSTTSNRITLGNANLTSFRVGNVASWTTASDRSLKTDIQVAKRGLSFIKALRPVLFELKGNKSTQLGFIAQEVEAVDETFPGLLKPENSNDFYALNYEAFIPALARSIQEIDEKITAPTASISSTHRVLEDQGALMLALGTLFYLMCVCVLVFMALHLRRL